MEDTPFYHCMARCVRHAYLCGDDYGTGKNFDHRKQYFQPASKKQGEVGDGIFCEKVERLPVFHDFIDFPELANGYEDKYEKVIISEIYQDTSEEDTDISA